VIPELPTCHLARHTQTQLHPKCESLTPTVAKAAVLALQTPHAAGQRYILTSEPLYGNDVALDAANVYPERDINKGNSDAAFRAELAKNATVYDGSKAARELGFTYVSRDDTLAETFRAVDAMKK
jgi:nucleoside-diphosphate-sugar epimerase